MGADLKALANRLYEAMSEEDMDAVLDQMIDDSFVDHEELPPGIPPGKEAPRAFFKMIKNAFPDFHATVEDMFVVGDTVIARGRFEGTHQGEFMGVAPTGNHVDFAFFDQLRFSDDRLVEHWGLTDDMAMMQQLGAIDAGAMG